MKLPIYFLLLFVFFSQISMSQNNRAIFRLGGATNYYYGVNNSSVNELNFQKNRLSFEMNAALGIQTFNEKKKPKNTFAMFGRIGIVSEKILNNYLSDQELSFDIDSSKDFNDFQELEVGVIIQQAFRLSFGYGWLNFYNTTHKPETLRYYCFTTGFSIPFGSLVWNIYLTGMGGKDFNNFVFRPSTGLTIQLD